MQHHQRVARLARRTLFAAALLCAIAVAPSFSPAAPSTEASPRLQHVSEVLGSAAVHELEQHVPPGSAWSVYLPMTYRLSGVAPVVASVARGFHDGRGRPGQSMRSRPWGASPCRPVAAITRRGLTERQEYDGDGRRASKT